ncbi:bacillithiol system redox-active protein YtxJ [Muriicola sp.]|uniref:bacillithiol system redox-active protein YtxJ n=1 Tax=Muriicola sp. TaxID=2020856 RepID=UPI003C7453A5
MGLFDLFKKHQTSSESKQGGVPWNSLSSEEDLDRLIDRSSRKPQCIFKNSTSCGISSMVLRSLEAQYDLKPEQADFYLLHIQHNRPLSNQIAQRFNIRHESPQLLIIKNGQVVRNASHGAITEVSIAQYL